MKKNLLSVLILVLMIVNIAMSAVMMISVTGTNQKTAQLADSILLAMNLELNPPGNETNVPLSESSPYDMGSMTILLAPTETVGADGTVSKSKDTYILFDIALLQNIKHEDYATYSATLSSYNGMIKDAIEKVVGAHTEEQCRESFSSDIRDEILRAVQNLFKSEFIYQITISNVKYGG